MRTFGPLPATRLSKIQVANLERPKQVTSNNTRHWQPKVGVLHLVPDGQSLFSARAAAEARGIRSVASVTTMAEFVIATEMHVQRVGVLAQALLRRHRAEFAAVDEKILAEYAAIHDAAKTSTGPEFLAQHKLARPLAEDLVKHWGTMLKVSPDSPNPLIETLNRVDTAVENKFFEDKGISSDVANLYRLIVEVADKVDRGMAPLSRYEEMGKTAVPVGEYLKRSTGAHDARVMRLAQELEADYQKLIPAEMNYFDARGQ